MEVCKIMLLSKWVICGFHVNLPGCMITWIYNGYFNPLDWVNADELGIHHVESRISGSHATLVWCRRWGCRQHGQKFCPQSPNKNRRLMMDDVFADWAFLANLLKTLWGLHIMCVGKMKFKLLIYGSLAEFLIDFWLVGFVSTKRDVQNRWIRRFFHWQLMFRERPRLFCCLQLASTPLKIHMVHKIITAIRKIIFPPSKPRKKYETTSKIHLQLKFGPSSFHPTVNLHGFFWGFQLFHFPEVQRFVSRGSFVARLFRWVVGRAAAKTLAARGAEPRLIRGFIRRCVKKTPKTIPWDEFGIFTNHWLVDFYGKCRSIYHIFRSYGQQWCVCFVFVVFISCAQAAD